MRGRISDLDVSGSEDGDVLRYESRGSALSIVLSRPDRAAAEEAAVARPVRSHHLAAKHHVMPYHSETDSDLRLYCSDERKSRYKQCYAICTAYLRIGVGFAAVVDESRHAAGARSVNNVILVQSTTHACRNTLLQI